jgi:hypothetical protein
MIKEFEFTDGAIVQMWTPRRLPYLDRQSVEEKAACNRLKLALKQMPDDASKVLLARYTSPHDGLFDIENVLGYNIGMSAFGEAAKRGMIFERQRSMPPIAPSGVAFEHQHTYMLVPIPQRPPEGISVEFNITSVREVYDIWWALANSKPTENIVLNGRFALHIEIGLGAGSKLPAILKKLLDGVVAGFQYYPYPDHDAVQRLSQRMPYSPNEITARLAAPTNPLLGSRSKLLTTYRDFVKWNPADDGCDKVTVIATSNIGLCKVTLSEWLTNTM